MTQEVYPKIDEFNLVSDVVEAYLDFIDCLKTAKTKNIDNPMLLEVINLFYSVKTDDAIINELKKWLDELDGLVDENKNEQLV